MIRDDYLITPGWRELVVEPVFGRPTQVWRQRPRHVLDLFELSAGKDDLDFLVQGDRRFSFGTFRAAVENGAAALETLGVRSGDRVFIILFNSPEFLLAQWSIWRLGAVPVLGNRWWSEKDILDMIERMAPALVITDIPLPNLNAGTTQLVHPDLVSQWWSVSGNQTAVADPRPESSEDDVALIEFTAGSTGVPKAVQLSHRNLVWTQQTFHIIRGGRPPAPATADEQKVALKTTPMFHNGAVVAGLAALIDGNRIILLTGKFNPEEVMGLIEKEKVTSWNAVPTMFKRVLEHEKAADFDLSSLVAPSTGGMIMSPKLLGLVKKHLPKAAATFSVGYGMTELAFLGMASAEQIEQRPGTVGRPPPGVDVKLENPDGTGEGEILGRSGAMMVGYLGVDKQPIDSEGWYHTGDLGRIDQDGFLYVTGRAKDMIIRGGENISCSHVEGVLGAHENVLEVAVVGYPDEDFGEAVAAIVHLRPGTAVPEEELRQFARKDLAYFEVPSLWQFRDDPLPVLPTGKTDKRRLAREIADGVAAKKN